MLYSPRRFGGEPFSTALLISFILLYPFGLFVYVRGGKDSGVVTWCHPLALKAVIAFRLRSTFVRRMTSSWNPVFVLEPRDWYGVRCQRGLRGWEGEGRSGGKGIPRRSRSENRMFRTRKS